MDTILCPGGLAGSKVNRSPLTCRNRPSCMGYLETPFSIAFNSVSPLTTKEYDYGLYTYKFAARLPSATITISGKGRILIMSCSLTGPDVYMYEIIATQPEQ